MVDLVGSVAEAAEEAMDLLARLEEAREALTRSTAPIDFSFSAKVEASEAVMRSTVLIDSGVARGIDDGMAGSTERLNSLSRIRRLSPAAKFMHHSSVCALGVIGSSAQLSHSSTYVPQRRMSKEHTSAGTDRLLDGSPPIAASNIPFAQADAQSSSDQISRLYSGSSRVPTKGVSQAKPASAPTRVAMAVAVGSTATQAPS